MCYGRNSNKHVGLDGWFGDGAEKRIIKESKPQNRRKRGENIIYSVSSVCVRKGEELEWRTMEWVSCFLFPIHAENRVRVRDRRESKVCYSSPTYLFHG